MGSFMSSPAPRTKRALDPEIQNSNSSKRLKMSPIHEDNNPRLIPSLPDEISLQILARVPRIHHLALKSVSRSWKAAITGDELYKLRKELKSTEEWLYILVKNEEEKLHWHAFDPTTKNWLRIPPMPCILNENNSNKSSTGLCLWNMMGSSIKGWLGQRGIFNKTTFCGCSVGAVDGRLYVLGGFLQSTAVKCVWKYDPRHNSWEEINPMSTGRAYCKISKLNGKIYVVGGVSRERGSLVPLQSAEVFDPVTGNWDPLPSMPFSKGHLLPTPFLAEMLKPIATGMTSYMGKLYVPQSLYSWPFFVDVGGEVFDPETGTWAEMPAGMGEGWPAKQAGTKLSVIVDGELYALDPVSSLDSGKIKVYDEAEDSWRVVVNKVPVYDFTDSESPYLLAGIHGKLHVVTRDASNDIVVLQADLPGLTPSSPGNCSNSPGDVFKILATKSLGMAELVSCQVLEL